MLALATLAALLPAVVLAGPACVASTPLPDTFSSSIYFSQNADVPYIAPFVGPFFVAGTPVNIFYDSQRLIKCTWSPANNASYSIALNVYSPELQLTQSVGLNKVDVDIPDYRPTFNGSFVLSPSFAGKNVQLYAVVSAYYPNGTSCLEYDSNNGQNYRFPVQRNQIVSVKLDVGQTNPSVVGAFQQGSILAVEHNPARTTKCRGTDRGFPAWGVNANVQFDSTGVTKFYASTVNIAYNATTGIENVQPAVGYIPIPLNATSFALWFENYFAPRFLACIDYDSNNGLNWRYTIGAADNVPVITSSTFEDAGSSISFSNYDGPFIYPSYLLAGGKVNLGYATDRLKVCRYDSNSIPTYTIDFNLYSRELDSVQTIRLQKYDNDRTEYAPYFYGNAVINSRFAAVSSQVEVWAKIGCVYPNGTTLTEYDSNNSNNFIFPIFKKKASAKLTFNLGATAPIVDGTIEAGSVVLIEHDPARTPTCRGSWRGFDAWGVSANVIFDSTPIRYSDATTSFNYNPTNGVPTGTGKRVAIIPVPHNATNFQLYFTNTYAPGYVACTSYDSNNSKNFVFNVTVSRENIRVPAFGVASLDAATSTCLSYNVLPQNNFAANFCEFYVNTVQVDYTARYFTVAALLKPTEGTVLSYGLYVRTLSADSKALPRDFFVYASEANKLTTGFAWGTLFQVQRYALFLDVRRNNGTVVRLWISNNGSDYGVAQLLPAAATGLQTVGASSILYDSKRKCAV